MPATEGPDAPGLLTRTGLLATMARHGLEPHRTLGQNFVVDANTIRRIVRMAGVGAGDRVVEIGPGLGSLTLGLLGAGAAVTAVEIDGRLLDPLRENVGDSVRLVHADAMEVDWPSVLGAGPWTAVANLPYNVATPVVLRLLEEAPVVERMLVMVQREVGERLAAVPGSKAYGIPSVKVAFRAQARVVGTVGADVFHPRPRVTSALVAVERRATPVADVDPALLWRLIDAGFGQRRKMLRGSLAGLVDEAQLRAAGVAPTARAEELTVEDWCRVADVVAADRR